MLSVKSSKWYFDLKKKKKVEKKKGIKPPRNGNVQYTLIR